RYCARIKGSAGISRAEPLTGSFRSPSSLPRQLGAQLVLDLACRTLLLAGTLPPAFHLPAHLIFRSAMPAAWWMSAAPLDDLSRFRLRRGLLPGASPLEDVLQAVIAFVTRVLEQGALNPGHWNCGRPWSRKDARIVDRDLVINRLGVDAREALDQT